MSVFDSRREAGTDEGEGERTERLDRYSDALGTAGVSKERILSRQAAALGGNCF